MNISIELKVIEKVKAEEKATLLFGGDFCPVRRYEKKIIADEAIFSPALNRELQKKDFFIVNLESPLCNQIVNGKLNGGGMGCAPKVAKKLKNFHIDVAGLANNHIMDKTESGLLQTMELLKDNGIICGGAGKNMEAASQMIILKKESLKIGIMFIAEKELNIASKDLPGAALFDPEMNKLEIIKNRGKVDFLAISVHAGHEFMQDPSPRIRQAYRSFIQAGANIVIGHHPHVVQGIEKYGQGWIFYSLGNLVFDSQYVSGYENTDQGYLSRITAGRNRVLGVEIIPYKMKKCIEVAELAPDELWEWRLWLQKISLLITNDKKFSEAWRKNVKKRWNQDYKELLTSFSCRFENDSDKSFLSWLRNFIQCPTTEEFICASLDLLEEGVLKRKPEEK